MADRMGTAHHRPAVMAAIALGAISGACFSAILSNKEARVSAPIPDDVVITGSPVSLARERHEVQVQCLAEAMYFEARGEGVEGEKAVAEVVLARTKDARYPKTVCAVVYDGAGPGRKQCQFSFACDGLPETLREVAAWRRLWSMADQILVGAERLSGKTRNAIFFHNAGVMPAWAAAMQKTAEIGHHIFYRHAPQQYPAQAPTADRTPVETLVSLYAFAPIVPSEEIEPEIQTASAVGDSP